LLLLWPALVLADAPKVEPSKIECEPRDLIQFKVSAEAGKTLVAGELPADKFVVFEIKPGVFVAQPQKNASGTYTLQFWHAGDTVTLPKVGPLPALPVATLTVVVGGEQPKPKPDPNPVPPPVSGKLRVVIVEETKDATIARGRLVGSTELFKYMADQNIRWRIVDKDGRDAGGMLPNDVKTYVEDAASRTLPWMYVVDSTGKLQFEGTPPAPAEVLTLLKKIGGGQ
jgi:hypothetical protein